MVHNTDVIDRLSGELQGAVYCKAAHFDPEKLAKLLATDANTIEALLHPQSH